MTYAGHAGTNTVRGKRTLILSMKFFRPLYHTKLFQAFRAVPKIGSIFTTYQFSGTLTGRGVSRVNYDVPRLSKLHEDARRYFKDFQQVWFELEMFKACRDDMLCEVKKDHPIWWSFRVVEKVETFIA